MAILDKNLYFTSWIVVPAQPVLIFRIPEAERDPELQTAGFGLYFRRSLLVI